MPIDPKAVKWDAAPATTPAIDRAAIKWDDEAKPATRTWRQTGSEALSNIPASAYKFASEFVNMLMNPGQTVDNVMTLLNPTPTAETMLARAAVGQYVADRYGGENALKNSIATDPVGVAADLSTVLSGGAALPGRTGAIAGKAARVLDPMTVPGRLITAGGGLAMRGVENVARGAKTNVLMQAAEGRAPAIINALRDPNAVLVPGSQPTAAEAAAKVGATRYSQLQASAAESAPTEYFERGQAQQSARTAAVRQVGQTPAALQAAVNARKAEAKLLYGQAGANVVTGDATLDALRARPSMQQAFERAERLAREDGYSLQGALQNGSWSGQAFTVADLHYVKMGLDDLISSTKQAGIGAAEQSKILNTRQQFLDWLETHSPDYKVARETFTRRSQPINQMEVGQYLEGKLTSALEGEATLRPGAFSTALRDAPGTIKRATTGGPRYENLSDVLTPAQVKIVESVRDDLARTALFEKQAGKARAAGPKAGTAGTELAVEALGGAQFPTLLNRVATVANALLRRLTGKIDRTLAMEIAMDMLDPNRAALALETAQARAARVEAVSKPVRAIGAGAVRAGTPATVINNAMNPENRNALRPQ